MACSVLRPGFGLQLWFVTPSCSGVIVALVLAAHPVWAKGGMSSASPDRKSGETVSYTASQQRAVPALRQAELRKLQAVDAINRQTQACLQGSTTLEALANCHQQSHQAMATLRKTFHQEISQLRDSYGLPKPSEPDHRRHGQPDQG